MGDSVGRPDETQLTPAELRTGLVRVREAARSLRRRPLSHVLDALDDLVCAWLDPGGRLQRHAEEVLAAATGFAVEMVRHGLPLQLAPLRSSSVLTLLERELGSRGQVEGPASSEPPLIAHVLAGNIPALAAVPMTLTLAVRAAGLLKPAEGDPLFARLFHDSLRDRAPELADCLLVSRWPGGSGEWERLVFESADVVVASGSDAAIAAVRPRVRGRFIGHGHRVSFALVPRESVDSPETARRAARGLAYDVTLWDQQGCLSPQFCWIEPGAMGAEGFAELVGEELERWAAVLPPRRLSPEEAVAVQRFRHEAEWRPGHRLVASRGSTAWSVSIEPEAQFLPSCLNRCLRVQPIVSLSVLPQLLSPHRGLLEAVGLGTASGRQAELAALLGAAGVHRVCGLGEMQTPDLDWQPGGRPRVREWLE